MRTHLVTFVATLGLVGFVSASAAPSAAPAGGGYSGGGASSSAGVSSGGGGGGAHSGGGGGSGAHSGGGGGGGGHASGGGSAGAHSAGGGVAHAAGAHTWSEGRGYQGGNLAAGHTGYANHAGGGYTFQGAHGSYSIVGREAAGLGHGSAATQGDHTPRNTFALGPRTGSAATAALVRDQHMPRMPGQPGHPGHPFHGQHHYFTQSAPYYPPDEPRYGSRSPCPFDGGIARQDGWAFGCPQAIKRKLPPGS